MATGIPRHWSEFNVESMMEEAGYEKPEAVGRPYASKGTMTWKIRAATAHDKDYDTVT